MSAKGYMTKQVQPLIDRLKKLLLKMIVHYMDLKRNYDTLSPKYVRVVQDKAQYGSRIDELVAQVRGAERPQQGHPEQQYMQHKTSGRKPILPLAENV